MKPPGASRQRPVMQDTDYIIVGAGSAGCALASRLTENGRHRVTVLEAGGSDRCFFVQMPLGYGKTFYDKTCNWMYEAEPDPGLIEIAGSLDPATLDLPAVTELLAFAGLDSADGPALPAESAGIQALLEALPTDLRNRLLAGFFSDIFTANR